MVIVFPQTKVPACGRQVRERATDLRKKEGGGVHRCPMQPLFATNDGTLALLRRLCHGHLPMEDLHDLPRRRVHKRAFQEMDNHRKADNKVAACHTQMDRNPCMASRRNLCLRLSSDPDPVVLFHQILA